MIDRTTHVELGVRTSRLASQWSRWRPNEPAALTHGHVWCRCCGRGGCGAHPVPADACAPVVSV